MDVGSREPGEAANGLPGLGPFGDRALLDVLGEQTHWGPLLGTTPWSRNPCARLDEHGSRVTLGTRSSFRQPGYPWQSNDFKGPIGFASPPYGGFAFVEDVAGHIQFRSAALEGFSKCCGHPQPSRGKVD